MSADLLQTTLKKLIQYVGTKYGEDTADELENCQMSYMTIPQHTAKVQWKHGLKVTLKQHQQNALLMAHDTTATNLQAELTATPTQEEHWS